MGPGLLESTYEQCLAHELKLNSIGFKLQHPQSVDYKSVRLDCGYRADRLITAASLRDSGSIVLFWNHYPDLDTAFSRALDEVYKSEVPQLAGSPKTMPPEVLVKRTVEAIDASGFYKEVMVERYPWSEQYSVDQYLKLLNTYSDHLDLTEDIRRKLFVGVSEVIEQYGGVVNRPYLAVLYFTKVKR